LFQLRKNGPAMEYSGLTPRTEHTRDLRHQHGDRIFKALSSTDESKNIMMLISHGIWYLHTTKKIQRCFKVWMNCYISDRNSAGTLRKAHLQVENCTCTREEGLSQIPHIPN